MGDPSPDPSPAPCIRKLEEEVVNRIAAGEVIHRPASALKEMLENSLDAGATQITVLTKKGGLRLLQIQDNGHGIRLEDMPIVCERFTTSKLQTFADLSTIRTFGFRGEALASITHVAKVTVTSMTEGALCAYTAQYAAGRITGGPPGAGAEGRPTPCAGTRGTTISVEDLFHNVPTRRKALKSPPDEYQRILEVVTRYAINNPSCGMHCSKAEAGGADVHTPKDSTPLKNIGLLFGQAVARELVPVSRDRSDDATLAYKVEGLVSGANYSSRRAVFILFINRRLVDCGALKRAVEAAYQSYLPKNAHPFLYLSVVIRPDHLDVNVHPTKKEVHFLNEAEVVADIHDLVAAQLSGQNDSRTLAPAAPLATPPPPMPRGPAALGAPVEGPRPPRPGGPTATGPGAKAAKEAAQRIVRVAEQRGAMERYIRRGDEAGREGSGVDLAAMQAKRQKRVHDPNQLTSVSNLLAAADAARHSLLGELFEKGVFVGTVDHRFSLAQYRTGLYLLDMCAVTRELVCQMALQSFGRLPVIRITTRPLVSDLLAIALDTEGVWQPDFGAKAAIVAKAANLLQSKAEMLAEYLSVQLDAEGRLVGLPQVLPDYVPPLARLPLFLLRLATDVEWGAEQRCFDTLTQELADLYAFPSVLPLEADPSAEASQCPDDTGTPGTAPAPATATSTQTEGTTVSPSQPSAPPHPAVLLSGGSARHLRWLSQHVAWPAARTFLAPPRAWAANGTVVQVACLENLYKVFERC